MSTFIEAVERRVGGLRGLSVGACHGCSTCGTDHGADSNDLEAAEEPHFSWSACDSCGSTLGGNRHPAHYLSDENEIKHLDVCEDCLVYHANGDEPEDWEG